MLRAFFLSTIPWFSPCPRHPGMSRALRRIWERQEMPQKLGRPAAVGATWRYASFCRCRCGLARGVGCGCASRREAPEVLSLRFRLFPPVNRVRFFEWSPLIRHQTERDPQCGQEGVSEHRGKSRRADARARGAFRRGSPASARRCRATCAPVGGSAARPRRGGGGGCRATSRTTAQEPSAH